MPDAVSVAWLVAAAMNPEDRIGQVVGEQRGIPPEVQQRGRARRCRDPHVRAAEPAGTRNPAAGGFISAVEVKVAVGRIYQALIDEVAADRARTAGTGVGFNHTTCRVHEVAAADAHDRGVTAVDGFQPQGAGVDRTFRGREGGMVIQTTFNPDGDVGRAVGQQRGCPRASDRGGAGRRRHVQRAVAHGDRAGQQAADEIEAAIGPGKEASGVNAAALLPEHLARAVAVEG